jgi:hypothetical protein
MMAVTVRYLPIDGEYVSWEWWVFLTAARRDGVSYYVREGHRTWARQAYFWSGSPTNPRRTWRGNLAAPPSNDAPHIRTGRFWHACDFGGAQALIWYGARHGVTLVRTVRGEEWHLEANPAQLAAFARNHGARVVYPTLRLKSSGPEVTRVRRRSASFASRTRRAPLATTAATRSRP